jgi:hypothetical protein
MISVKDLENKLLDHDQSSNVELLVDVDGRAFLRIYAPEDVFPDDWHKRFQDFTI